MVRTPSTMLPLATTMPDFALTNAVDSKTLGSNDLGDHQAYLVMFICNHCPFVQHVREEIGRLAADYIPKGIGIVAINSNDIQAYPQDAPQYMKGLAESDGWKFPFLFDVGQNVAKAFQAACTPDFFLFDANKKLVYRGQLDDSRPGNDIPVTGTDLRKALDAVLDGRPPLGEQKASLGCNIKWKAGNEPGYFGR